MKIFSKFIKKKLIQLSSKDFINKFIDLNSKNIKFYNNQFLSEKIKKR